MHIFHDDSRRVVPTWPTGGRCKERQIHRTGGSRFSWTSQDGIEPTSSACAAGAFQVSPLLVPASQRATGLPVKASVPAWSSRINSSLLQLGSSTNWLAGTAAARGRLQQVLQTSPIMPSSLDLMKIRPSVSDTHTDTTSSLSPLEGGQRRSWRCRPPTAAW